MGKPDGEGNSSPSCVRPGPQRISMVPKLRILAEAEMLAKLGRRVVAIDV